MAQALMSVQREHRRSYIEGMQGLPTERDRRREERSLRNEYEPRYIGAARQELEAVAAEAGGPLLSELGLEADALPLEDVIPSDDLIEHHATALGQEAYNRASGWYRENLTEEVETGSNTRITLLGVGTMASIASKGVSSAYGSGREVVIDQIKEAAPPSSTFRATRTAILDDSTCEECDRLDGTTYVYDSDRYHRYRPPSKCSGFGNPRCRCQYQFEIGIDLD